jgi:hypothetical protein
VAEAPHKDYLEESLTEVHRVLKQDGTLALIIPTILVCKCEDPLSIGNFIEKYEHEASEKSDYVESKALRALIQNLFNRVEEKQIVHMTYFLASQPHLLH